MDLSHAIASAINQQSFELILLPTEQCNFRCFYCYEDFKLKSMTRNTIEGIKNLISRKQNLKHLSISWFGGEPMLALNWINEISEHVKNLLSQGRIKTFQSAMTTNGFYLNNENLDILYQAGIKKFQITLDGDKEVHDRLRKDSRGKGTFDIIWANLQNIKQRTDLQDIEIYLRLHYQDATVNQVKEFIPKLDAELLTDQRFKLLFHSVEPLGGSNDHQIKRLTSREKTRLEAEFFELMTDPDQIAKKSLEPNGVYICYAAKTNSLVIRADGSLAKCTVAFADPRNRVGTLNPDGTVSVDGQKMGIWIDNLKSQDLAQLACPYSFMKNL